MMFDPPDYPYKELSETYDDLLLSKNICSDVPDAVDETVITGANSQLAFQSNDSGRFFSTENTFLQDNTLPDLTQNTEMYVIQADTLFSNYEPTLLDENTVNEFLLPLQESSNNKDIESNGPDLLALHSCVICHDIFTTEADLLDHTIAFHASHDVPNDSAIALEENALSKTLEVSDSSSSANPSFETDWLVCRLCQRVLATSLEVEPTEQLCCIAENGKCAVFTRKLHTMFVCDVCSGLFADGEALDKHRMSCYVDDNNFYETSNTENFMTSSEYTDACFNSGQQSTEDLANHLADTQRQIKTGKRSRTYTTSNSNKMWNCGSCNQLFTTARELYRHKRGEDRPEGSPLTAYVCDECDKVLGSMCALHTHKKMHRTSKPGYPCRICGRRFNQSGHLAIHMRMHTGERPYPCDLCPKAFKVKVERDDHRRTHTGERPFACPACPKTFTAAARLREHARIHTDQRPYKCDICGAAFRRPYARTVHTLIHTGEKPHECDICGTAFRRSGDMWKHKRTLHGV